MAADKVLIVDDEEGIRRVLSLSLGEVGYQVLTAPGGREGLDLVRSNDPPIVLADIKMPGMDGIELLQTIKEERPNTEVIEPAPTQKLSVTTGAPSPVRVTTASCRPSSRFRK